MGTSVAKAEITTPSLSLDWILAALSGRVLPELPNTDDPWQDIVLTAARHGLAPLLWRQLSRRTGAPPVPSHFLKELQRRYLANAASNLSHFQELGRVLGALHAAGIPAIVLKGACLAKAVYGNIALRTIGDADVMVPPEEMKRAVSVMQSLGYTSESRVQADAVMEYWHQLPSFTKAGKLTVELHWTFVDPYMLLPFTRSDLEEVWARSFPLSLGGAPARSLCPEDMLLHLCFHASAHHLLAFKGLRACFDIALLITRYQDILDWDRFQQRAVAWGMQPSVLLTLSLARDIANACVPPAVLDGLCSDELPGEIVQQALTNMFNPSKVDVGVTTNENLVEFGNSSLMGGLLVAFRRAFPSRGEMAAMYPAPADSWSLYLYYPVRWRDLILNHARNVLRLTSQDRPLRDHLGKQQALLHWLRPRA